MNAARQTEWVEIVVPVPHHAAADVAGFLATTIPEAHAGVELREDSVVFWVPVPDGTRVLRETRTVVSRITTGGMAVDPEGVRLQPAAPEDDWRDAWMRHFRVTRVTRRIVIVPSWETYAPVAGDVVLAIDPGRAFGTGAHASTRLCLMELDDLSLPGPPAQCPPVIRFLDLGTGSGLHAIATAKLWAGSSGLAIDIDPTAVEVAAENVRRNRVAGRVMCAATPLEAVAERFDLIAANLQADVLWEIRDVLAPRLASGGILILAGLLSEDAEGVASAYAAFPGPGFRLLRIRGSDADPAWRAAVLQRADDRGS